MLDQELVTPVFQPLVDLESGRVVAYEALARGPRGGLLEQPAALFAVAREADRLAELDSLCRSRAVALAREAELPAGLGLFVNVEPDALAGDRAGDLEAPADVRPFAEITERALTARPAELLAEEQANIGAAVGGGAAGALLGLALPLFTRKSTY